jgi:hypothetical protein
MILHPKLHESENGTYAICFPLKGLPQTFLTFTFPHGRDSCQTLSLKWSEGASDEEQLQVTICRTA